MKKTVTVLHLLFMFMTVIFVNCVYSNPQYSPQGQHEYSTSAAEVPLMGKVVETMNGGGYTYILLRSGTEQVWVAIREMEVIVGQDIALMPGIEMTNFTAKSINRTFESIIFSDGPISSKGSVSGHGGAVESRDNQMTAIGSKGAVPHAHDDIKVDRATDPNGYTIVELYEKRSELNKKDIVLRGQVVKVSTQIMGKNWLHIQDGTGYSQNGTNDIVVTTKDIPSVGDVVTIKGILYSDKDFGSGYRYDAIIEQANVTK